MPSRTTAAALLASLAALTACGGSRASAGDAGSGAGPEPADADPGAPDPPEEDAMARPLHVLAFSRTAGFRHSSIEPAVEALRGLAGQRGWTFDHAEDPARFTDEGLAGADVIVFLLTTGDVLDEAQQGALERWLKAGRGWVGVHSASDTEYDWPWYGGLVGAYFAAHPAIQRATVRVESRDHPATMHLRDAWEREDEWYDFRANPRADVDVLLTVDESTYQGGGMGADHPVAWSRAYGGGRSFYTALGHTDASWAEPAFLAHVAGGLTWAAGR